ncbi:hypothetical protein V6N11_022553 [Hibiscus sabdariffa]|uniref:Uncharacterized protein n=1 Tax=Hibiscus sabdariffa TaxID=183260 RepID=A0ABR2TJJ4_9ROSI
MGGYRLVRTLDIPHQTDWLLEENFMHAWGYQCSVEEETRDPFIIFLKTASFVLKLRYGKDEPVVLGMRLPWDIGKHIALD